MKILEELDCHSNQLTSLPPMLQLKTLICHDNPLPGFDWTSWKEIWERKSDNEYLDLFEEYDINNDELPDLS